ncbi:MAG: hypothetical protein JWQ04_1921 [Pedosphaera sp.]|nr:hypothetical protein [Pedosphaera sp.]
MKRIWPRIIGVLLALAVLAFVSVCLADAVGTFAVPKPALKRLLVVTVTKGYRHASIAVGERVAGELAAKSGAFTVDYARTDEDLAAKMTAEGLKHYDGVFFLNTTGKLPLPDKQAFLDWIKSGKGFIGTHSATDTFHGDGVVDPYIEMIGAEFASHTVAKVECLNEDPTHPATRDLGKTYPVFDEIYVMKNFSPAKVHILLRLDKAPGSDRAGYFPIAWCKKYGDGKVFYTALGHEDAVWESPAFQLHLLGGIKWALGLEAGNAAPQAKDHIN